MWAVEPVVERCAVGFGDFVALDEDAAAVDEVRVERAQLLRHRVDVPREHVPVDGNRLSLSLLAVGDRLAKLVAVDPVDQAIHVRGHVHVHAAPGLGKDRREAPRDAVAGRGDDCRMLQAVVEVLRGPGVDVFDHVAHQVIAAQDHRAGSDRQGRRAHVAAPVSLSSAQRRCWIALTASSK
jgi:hypothetical protein